MENQTTEQNAFPVQENVSSTTNAKALLKLPIPLLAVAAYLAMGFLGGLWHPGWLIFLAIPVYYQLVAMAAATGMRKKLNRFPIAVLCAAAYLLLGFFFDVWHPSWMIFLAVPLYHCLVGAIFRT
jgi:uncharacterized membrane protein YjjP (DUF1212 family)